MDILCLQKDTNTTHVCKANLSVIALPSFVKYAELQAHAHNFWNHMKFICNWWIRFKMAKEEQTRVEVQH